MILPKSISDVTALETRLKESGCNPNDYLPTTIQMKFLLHDHAISPIPEFESCLREEAKKIFALLQPEPAQNRI